MANSQSNKGNPASKRMTNTKLQARRQRSWLAGQQRKATRVAAQKAREQANREARAAGLPTPWERRQADRATRRHPLHVSSGVRSTRCRECVS